MHDAARFVAFEVPQHPGAVGVRDGLPERDRVQRLPTPLGHGGVGVDRVEHRVRANVAVPHHPQVRTAERGGDLGGLQERAVCLRGVDDLVEPRLRAGVLDTHARRLGEQQVGRHGCQVRGERDVHAGPLLSPR
ncbi:hypothetical protein [Lentzea flava]|uniref:hypothetical protein n=1 Tax=Lentzea flava TaxID=103732 RepID=UPI001E4D3655|nr:hypothetical protein [Lentzea flava]